MKFFVLQNPKLNCGNAETDFLPVDDAPTGDAPRCEVCGRFIGMLPLLPPVRVELECWGSLWGDLAFGPGDQILVSSRLRELFAESGLLGLKSFDFVTVEKVKRRNRGIGSPPHYWLASIQRSRALLDEAASGLVREEASNCDECRIGGVIKRLDRVALQANSWSGEDVFVARGLPGTILASERFKRLCEANELANCSFVAAEEFRFDFLPHEREQRGDIELE